MCKELKERMGKLGISQTEMIRLLSNQNLVVQPPEMSHILNGSLTSPKAMRVLHMIDTILTVKEWQTRK